MARTRTRQGRSSRRAPRAGVGSQRQRAKTARKQKRPAVRRIAAPAKAARPAKRPPQKTRAKRPTNSKARAAAPKPRTPARTTASGRPAKASARTAKPPARRTRPKAPVARVAVAKPPSSRQASPKPAPGPARAKPAAPARAAAARTTALDRARRQLSDRERFEELDAPREAASPADDWQDSGPDERLLASARSGRDELRATLARHTNSSPTLTAGDVDARWEDAYAVGDEAPGGDNPTPDQDRVDDIGKALGINYRTDEVLQGGDEITARDRHRWELDPASSEDWPHEGEPGAGEDE